MNLNHPVFNKILMPGAGDKKKLFKNLKRRLLKENRKKINFSQLELELLIDALNRAEEYEYAIERIEEILDWGYCQVGILQKARMVYLEHGRTDKTAREVGKIIDAPRKHIPWELMAKDLNMLRFFYKTNQTFTFNEEKYTTPKETLEWHDLTLVLLYKKYKKIVHSPLSMVVGLDRIGVERLPPRSQIDSYA